jgi:hypothetical protein
MCCRYSTGQRSKSSTTDLTTEKPGLDVLAEIEERVYVRKLADNQREKGECERKKNILRASALKSRES